MKHNPHQVRLPQVWSADWERLAAEETGVALFSVGRQLFETGGVLEWHQPSTKILQALVANDRGRFERCKVLLGEVVSPASCSCGRSRAWCEHAIAALLAYLTTRQETPKLVQFREEGEAEKPVLELRFQAPEQPLESSHGRLPVQIRLLLADRDYAAGNLRRLVDSGTAAGGMQFADFTVQARQIIKFLAAAGPMPGERLTLDAVAAADLFHLLPGYPEVWWGEERLQLHPEILQPVLAVSLAGTDRQVSPRLQIAGKGLLPTGIRFFITGRAGYWIGLKENFWWLPGVLDPAWLNTFLEGTAAELAPGNFRQLRQSIGLTAGSRIVYLDETDEVAMTAPPAENRLYLDWLDAAVNARLIFDYDGIEISPDTVAPVWTGTNLVSRCREREKAAMAELHALGFVAKGRTAPGVFILADPEKIWDFWRSGLTAMGNGWRRFFSEAFIKARGAAGMARVELLPAAESGTWFELDLRLFSEQGDELAWRDVLDAVDKGRATVMTREGNLLHFTDSVRELITKLRAESYAQEEGRLRFLPFSAPAVRELLGPARDKLRTQWLQLAESLTRPPPVSPDLFGPDLSRVLRGYQKEGVAWLQLLQECGFHGILADEMGLGKTVQTLALLDWRRRTGRLQTPALVVCPTSLLENWRQEAFRFTPELRSLVIAGNDRAPLFDRLQDHHLLITSYALLRRDIRHYQDVRLDYLILDEAQHIKNHRTINARVCKALKAGQRLILTGTPLENAVHELWSLFDFLLPGYLGSRQKFRSHYEQPVAGGEENIRSALAQHIMPFILRRRKAEVCHELPPKMEQVVYCEFGPRQARLYTTFLLAGRELVREAKVQGWQHRRFHVLSILTRLRQVCSHPALLPAALVPGDLSGCASAKTELLQEMILESIDSGHRLILFSQFTSFFAKFLPWLKENDIAYEYLDGATRDRQARVDRFNSTPGIPIFLVSLKAGGTGLNLIGADTVIHYDQWWNPMVEDQATDRTHRIGQTRQVTSMKLLVRNSIEEKILQLQGRKRQLFNQMMDGIPARLGELTPEDLDFLFRE